MKFKNLLLSPFLITKGYFTTGNLVFKQDFGIPMDMDPAPC